MSQQNQDDKRYYGKFNVLYVHDMRNQDQFIIDIDRNGKCFVDAISLDIKKSQVIKKAEFMSNRIYKNIVVYCLLSQFYASFDTNNVRFVMEE